MKHNVVIVIVVVAAVLLTVSVGAAVAAASISGADEDVTATRSYLSERTPVYTSAAQKKRPQPAVDAEDISSSSSRGSLSRSSRSRNAGIIASANAGVKTKQQRKKTTKKNQNQKRNKRSGNSKMKTAQTPPAVPSAAPQAPVPERIELDHPVWKLRYVIVIDAGSSGSRIHVHPYEDAKPVPFLQPSKSLKLKPGLSSFAKDPQGSGANLNKLLMFAQEQIPPALWTSTPVFLKATAGLRSVSPADAEAVLNVQRGILQASPFLFKPEWAKIIPGSDEGVFGWIAANYLNGAFHRDDVNPVGVIEMGGASMQVTFSPKNADKSHKLFKLGIGAKSYSVYTHSYLGYGLESAQRLFLQKNKHYLEENGNPCYPKGTPGKSGTGSFESCAVLIRNMFEKEKCPDDEAPTCTWDGIYQPIFSSAKKYLTIENFYYTTKFFGVEKASNPLQALKEKGEKFCAQPWEAITAKYPKEGDSNLVKYCFSAAYIGALYELLHGSFETIRATPPPSPSAAAAVTGVSSSGAATTTPPPSGVSASAPTIERVEYVMPGVSDCTPYAGTLVGVGIVCVLMLYVMFRFWRGRASSSTNGGRTPAAVKPAYTKSFV